ncbi:thiamine pyrophosphate-dependent dehydrogenase E1 component subunit alpha [Kaarinaea lacus]
MTSNELLDLYTCMLRIRRVEESLADRYQDQQMRCPMHLCIGQEAIAAGISYWLQQNDHVYSNHRAHGHYLAKGGDLNRMVAELYGRSTGCCGGRGGSMHLIDQSAGFMGSTPIVGGTVPIAVGSAWAAQLRGEDRITVVYFGDGCFEEGVVHESLNFAALKQLPIVFVCENNEFSVYTKLSQRQPQRTITSVAQAHGLMAYEGDGNNALTVSTLARYAIAQARQGQAPQFLELKTHRWREHCGPFFDDNLGYREKGELNQWMQRCPIKTAENQLTQDEVLDEVKISQLEKTIKAEIDEAFRFALESIVPQLDELESSIYAA